MEILTPNKIEDAGEEQNRRISDERHTTLSQSTYKLTDQEDTNILTSGERLESIQHFLVRRPVIANQNVTPA